MDKTPVCRACHAYFQRIENPCQICALPLPTDSFSYCGQCSTKKPHFDKVFSSYVFDGPLRQLLHDFKYHQAIFLTKYLSTLMIEACSKNFEQPECLISVPLFPTRLAKRGFNQSQLLAKALSSTLKIPIKTNLLKKTIDTPRQAELPLKKRKKNLQNAFIAKPHPFRHIAIVDDVLTSGETANTLAKLLKNAGANTVDVICIARTLNITMDTINIHEKRVSI